MLTWKIQQSTHGHQVDITQKNNTLNFWTNYSSKYKVCIKYSLFQMLWLSKYFFTLILYWITKTFVCAFYFEDFHTKKNTHSKWPAVCSDIKKQTAVSQVRQDFFTYANPEITMMKMYVLMDALQIL